MTTSSNQVLRYCIRKKKTGILYYLVLLCGVCVCICVPFSNYTKYVGITKKKFTSSVSFPGDASILQNLRHHYHSRRTREFEKKITSGVWLGISEQLRKMTHILFVNFSKLLGLEILTLLFIIFHNFEKLVLLLTQP